MKPKHLGLVLAGLVATAPLTAEQKTARPQPIEQQKLKDRVDALESDVKALKENSADATRERVYVERIRTDTKEFYQQAFNSQSRTLEITGVILTVLLAIAGWFGFSIFDRHIDERLREATRTLREEFTKNLNEKSRQLGQSNAAQMKQLDEALQKQIAGLAKDLSTYIAYAFDFLQGLASFADHRIADALDSFRSALKTYKKGEPRDLLTAANGAKVVGNIFICFERLCSMNQKQLLEEAKKELADPLYNDLEDELARAALELDWLRPLVAERKPASPTPSQARNTDDK